DSSSSRDEYAGVRGGVAALVRQAQARVQSQLRALAADEPGPGEPERVRAQAEWLLALSSQITYANRPGGQEGFSLQDGMAAVEPGLNGQMQLVIFGAGADFGQPGEKEPGAEEGDLIVPLDPKRRPVEQAERMFDRAAKMERAARIIPRRRASLEADRAYLQQLENDLSLAQDQPEIVAVREALREAGYLRQRRDRREKAPRDRSRPLRYFSPEGFPILVGRNARQNEIVTFDLAGRDDLWLHVRDGPGAHVVIRCGGQPVPELTLNVAARLAAWYSGQRGNAGAAVAITPRRFVTRMAGGRPGQVHYRGEETISVAAELPAESEQWLAAGEN
ncbi:MAG: NFACT RNA binding domain-containing protein, partial [Caldilineaceae bacterium]|nr:NFACT RNA binding domain-containing protein [Caldilineaceae bacterium]